MKSKFWRFYLVFVLVILAALAGIHFYVKGIMVEYEKQDPSYTVSQMLLAASEEDGGIGTYLEEHAFNGSAGTLDAAKERFYGVVQSLQGEQAVSLAYEEDAAHSGSMEPVVYVGADGKPFLRVVLRETEKVTKLMIMNISQWEVASAILLDADREEGAPLAMGEDGLLFCKVDIPEGFTLLLDGEAIPADTPFVESALPEFEYVAPFTQVPAGRSYAFSGLAAEVKVSARNNAQEEVAAVQEAPGVYEIPANYGATKEAEEALAAIADPLYIGELWSQFMTDDVLGYLHGFYIVNRECMLLEGSNLYELADKWARSIDITFVSAHVITAWEKESVSNFIQYNENLISCDVYFEKVMSVVGQERVDVFDNRMYFVNITDPAVATPGWYLADMLSLAGTH